ncbi:MAG: sodium/proline symporter [candidate division Zixibacteria bacterium]|nr:sodium/proline symporter [candidate division Zixibacteria bacterium]
MESNLVLTLSFIVYSAGIIGFGLYSTRLRKKTEDDFVLANRELGPWAASLSASASSESGWVMLGLVGEAYAFGYSALWIIPGIAVGYLFNWFVIAERLRQSSHETGAITLTQFIMHRFGRKSVALRVIPVLIITAAMLGYVAAQMNAAGKAFQATFELDYTWGVLVGAAIILTYTVTGGFRAICWTDIIQASFMVIALLVMPIIIMGKLGGYSSFLSAMNEGNPDLLAWASGNIGFAGLGFVVGLLGIGLGYPGMPHVLSRFMAAKNFATIRKAGMISMVWFVLVYFGAIFFGLFARIYFPDLPDPEQALPIAVNEFLPPILGGFVIAAIVSAICSTADSQLIVISSTLSRDVILPLKKLIGLSTQESHDYASTQRWDRWILVLLAIVSVGFALSENRVIFDFVLYSWSALGASFGPVVILGLMWKGTTKAGVIAGMLVGVGVTVIWRNIPTLKGALYELVPAFVLAFVVVLVVSTLTSSTAHERNPRTP